MKLSNVKIPYCAANPILQHQQNPAWMKDRYNLSAFVTIKAMNSNSGKCITRPRKICLP